MANMPDVNKKTLCVRISLETYYRILHLVGGKKSKVQDVIRKILAAQVESVVLTEADYAAILDEIRVNRERQGRVK